MSIRRLTLMGLATLGLAAGGLVTFAAQTWAVTFYSEAGHFASPGTGDGGLSGPKGVAIDDATHDVYVLDAGNHRVDKFSASGTFLETWGWGVTNGEPESQVCTSNCEEGLAGSGAGQFGQPTQIAVDNSSGPSAGDVYVAEGGEGGDVQKFRASGEYLSSLGPFEFVLGAATDAAGNVWVSEGEQAVEFNDLGVKVTSWEWPVLKEGRIAVDSEDNVYTGLYDGSRARPVAKLSGTGMLLDADINPCGCATALAVDEASDELFLAEAEAQSEQGKSIARYSPSGKLVSRFGSFDEAVGVAVDSSNNEVYVVDAADDRVSRFELLTNVPATETLTISNPTREGVTLNANVNPEEIPITNCEFEYGPTMEYGKTAPCAQAPGSGNARVPVSAPATGLLSGQFYHYRIVATNENGTNHSAADVEFRYVAPATVNDVSAFASEVHSSEATLNGVIDPGNVAASYRFVWGPTSAYGSLAPLTELYTPVNETDDSVVPQHLVGLSPDTTYHFALVATNSAGTVLGPDETFTTPAIPVPGVETGPAGEVTRTGATLTGAVDPEGQSTSYWFEYGTSSAYGGRYPATSATAGEFTGAQSESIAVPNLQPGTTYHYRLVAEDAAGTVYGADQTFTTSAFPTSVIAEAPVLKAPLGINPETKANKIKPSGKGKHHKKKRKAKAKTKAKHGRKG